MICMVTRSETSSRSSSIAFRPVRLGSVTSTWVRTYWMPLRICLRRAMRARRLISSPDMPPFVSDQRWMPSKRVPLWFFAPGSRAVYT